MMTDDEFLSRLTELARRYGWLGDYEEVAQFVAWCHREMAKPVPPELWKPTPDEDDEATASSP